MENQIKTEDMLTRQKEKSRLNYWMISSFVLFVVLILAVLYFYNVINGFSEKAKQTPSTVSTIRSEAIVPSPSPISKVEIPTGWERADNLSAVTFEYPTGWHVDSIWPSNNAFITIYLDPKPLNGSPRGGPRSLIYIKDQQGLDNPQDQLNKNLEEARKNITDISETKFEVGTETFYKLEGKVNLYNEMVPVLQYHGLVKGPNNTNTHVISAELNYFRNDENHKQYAEILNKVVLSLQFRK